MKKVLLGAALAIAATFSAQAAEGPAFKFLLGAGITFGGDTLITVPFSDGSTDDIKAGGIVQFWGGAEYRVGDKVSVQATLGYHVNDTKAASNGSVRFTRVPVDLLGYYWINDQFRLGGGVQFVSGPELKGSGVASNVNTKFKDTTGGIIEGEYFLSPKAGVKVRFVSEKFERKSDGRSFDGDHIGVMFNYYF